MDLLRIARNPNNLIFALCISIIAHFALLYALGVLPFSRKPIQEESILVDFTLMDGKQGAGGKRQESGVRGRGSGVRGQGFHFSWPPASAAYTPIAYIH